MIYNSSNTREVMKFIEREDLWKRLIRNGAFDEKIECSVSL